MVRVLQYFHNDGHSKSKCTKHLPLIVKLELHIIDPTLRQFNQDTKSIQAVQN